jgi:prolipoprotein diacylglyceryltransferase
MTELPPQSVFFGLAILAAMAAVLGTSWRARFDKGTAFGLFSLAAVSAVFGARALWVLASPEAGLEAALERPELVWHPLRGGFASLGGWAAAAGVLAAATRRWSRALRWRFADVVVPPALTGMAIARLGCLSNGCDYGVVQSWGIRYAPELPAYHDHLSRDLLAAGAGQSLPTFPLPAVLSGATLLIALSGGIAIDRLDVGKTALFTCVGYFSVRLVAETFRAPATVELVAGPINANHVFALFGLVALVAAWRLVGPVHDAGDAN